MEKNLETNKDMSAVNLDQTKVESAEKMKLGMDVSNRRVFLISFILLSVVVMFAFGLGYLGLVLFEHRFFRSSSGPNFFSASRERSEL